MSALGAAMISLTLPIDAAAWVPVTEPSSAVAPGFIADRVYATDAPELTSSMLTIRVTPSPTVRLLLVNSSELAMLYPLTWILPPATYRQSSRAIVPPVSARTRTAPLLPPWGGT